MINKGISIIICCYNSSKRLPRTLEYIANQQINESILIEVLIVDNASTDNTTQLAQIEWDKQQCNFNFKIFEEKQPGLTNARICGVRNAQYEYLVFCDDDNWLSENYIQTAYEIMESDPLIGALGGQGIAVSDSAFPNWFEDVKGIYAAEKQAKENGDLKNRLHLWGAGLVTRSQLMNRVFDGNAPLLLVDRKGNALSSGGDSEICARIILLGYKLHYCDKLIFKHFISENRLTLEYKEALCKGFENIGEALSIYYDFVKVMNLGFIRRYINIIILLIRSLMIYFFKGKYSNSFKNKINMLAIYLCSETLSNDHKIIVISRFVNANK
jgi:glycosyltransferase involved in cell wall biosynthesis